MADGVSGEAGKEYIRAFPWIDFIANGEGEVTLPALLRSWDGVPEGRQCLKGLTFRNNADAYRTRRILTGRLGGIEKTDAGKTVVIVDYKGFRIVIPMKEMMINIGRSPSGQEYAELCRDGYGHT